LSSVPLHSDAALRKIGLVWRRGTGRHDEFKLLAQEMLRLARPDAISPPEKAAKAQRHS
jgi:hypothetical protein